MHTDTTPKEKPTGSANNPAGHTDSQIVPNLADTGKAFATWQHALRWLVTLHQSGLGDGPGPVSYLAQRWGMARHLLTLDDADKFLIQVGGADHDF